MKKLNKKGFSLVELIIVIAIMVALVAVMAPSFVKYVKSSREATLTNAVESIVEFAKSEYAVGNLKVASGQTSGRITVQKGTDKISIACENLTYDDPSTSTTETTADFVTGCGVEGNTASDSVYIITLTPQADGNVNIVTATSAAA